MKKLFTTLLSLVLAAVFLVGCGSITQGVDDPASATVKGKTYKASDLSVDYADDYPESARLSEEAVAELKAEVIGEVLAFGTNYKYYEFDENGAAKEAGTYTQTADKVTVSTEYGNVTAVVTGKTLAMNMSQMFGLADLGVTVTVSFTYNGTFGGSNSGSGDEEQGREFTVCLVSDGELFIPEETITVNWTDGNSYYSAEIGSDGYARVEGLDGDYRVTLSAPPETYIYNWNGYYATNDNRDVQIEIFKYNTTTLSGTSIYSDAIPFKTEGVYRVKILKASQLIYYRFVPLETGIYSIESWVDITANELNPKLQLHTGSSAAWYASDVIDGGGLSSSYTKNFRYVFEMASTNYSSLFGISVETRVQTTEFPCYIYFKLTREDDSGTNVDNEAVTVEPQETFRTFEERGSYVTADDNLYYNGRNYAFNEEDGYYWRIDPLTGEYLHRLYAKVNAAPCPFVGTPFLEMLISLSIYKDGVRYAYRPFLEEYAEHCNADGAYPVTKELQEFLQAFAIQQAYFMDGNGYAEGEGYNAAEEDQWLFACGYYA